MPPIYREQSRVCYGCIYRRFAEQVAVFDLASYGFSDGAGFWGVPRRWLF